MNDFLTLYIITISEQNDTMSSILPLPLATEFFAKVFKEPESAPMFVQVYGNLSIRKISPEWARLFRIAPTDGDMGGPQRTMYELTPEAIDALPVRNERGQPLIYVLLRFCNCPELRSAIIRSAPEYAFRLTTPDGSTPLIGMMYQQRYSMGKDEICRIAAKVGSFVWNMQNLHLPGRPSESAASLYLTCGSDCVVQF